LAILIITKLEYLCQYPLVSHSGTLMTMPSPKINKTVLMSGADYFDVIELNAYSHNFSPVNSSAAVLEFNSIKEALQQAGVNVVKVTPPLNCQDGIFTANWGLCRGDRVVLSSLPGPRQEEEAYAKKILTGLGKQVIKAPFRFSGQGDALPCGNYLLSGSKYRTDPMMNAFLTSELGYQVITLETIPERDSTTGQPVINKLSGWPDSFFYDIDLAIAVLRDDLIAWCPEAFNPESQDKIRSLPIQKIEVSFDEATKGFACNLVSTGQAVIMSAHAPILKAAIETYGISVVTPEITELAKGGGYIRCTTLTIDNEPAVKP
jgi:N-dimethylarginine dimethylaminohydrolase